MEAVSVPEESCIGIRQSRSHRGPIGQLFNMHTALHTYHIIPAKAQFCELIDYNGSWLMIIPRKSTF